MWCVEGGGANDASAMRTPSHSKTQRNVHSEFKTKNNRRPHNFWLQNIQNTPDTQTAEKVTMVAELDFHTVKAIDDSWESMRRIPNYEEKAGVLLFRK